MHSGNQPQEGETGWDLGNPLICARPVSLLTTGVSIPGQGTRLVLTIHTETGTTTIMADKATAEKWWRQIKAQADEMPASNLITGGGNGRPA